MQTFYFKIFDLTKMPRNYVRKTSKPFQGYRFDLAVNAIKNGCTIRMAARNFGVAYTTLWRHQQRNVPNYASVKAGRSSLFTDYQQRTLFKALSFHTLSFSELRKKVFVFAVNMNVKLPHNWKRNQISGMDWTRSFVKKFPSLSLFVKKGKNYRQMNFTGVNCVRLLCRSLVKFVCENCCLCTCKTCFNLKGYRCCADE